MKKALFRLLPVLLLLAIPACGGNPGTKVTFSAENYDGSNAFIAAAAYQTGNGEWQPLGPGKNGGFSFYVPAGEKRYGIAIRCEDMLALVNHSVGSVYLLTTDESTAPRLSYTAFGEAARVSGKLVTSGVTGAARSRAISAMESDDGGSNATAINYELDVPAGERAEIVVGAYDSSGKGVAARIIRGSGARGEVKLADISLNDADKLIAYSYNAFGVPSGWGDRYRLRLHSAGGAMIVDRHLFGYGGESGGPVRDLTGTREGDLY